MKKWPFYGRKKQISKLQNGLDFSNPKSNRLFQALRVRGPRGVGKTKLLIQMKEYAPSNTPLVIYELSTPGSNGTSVTATLQGLIVAANEAGLTNVKTVPEYQEWPNDYLRFKAYVRGLLQIGAVVVLDKFHLARDWGLDSYIKQVIDESVRSRENTPGKLVLMGSHQQKIDDMFQSDQPLFGRLDNTIVLRPWGLKTVLAMAAEQGILASPGKFLTLWTAYDGMPRNWERYFRGDSFTHLHDITDEEEWRVSFLETEGTLLVDDPRERWDAKTWIQLANEERELMLWIGSRSPHTGAEIGEMPEYLRTSPTRDQSLRKLVERLDLLAPTLPFLETGKYRWKMTDNNTLFQTHVFPEVVRPSLSPKGLAKQVKDSFRDRNILASDILVHRLKTLEGQALEQLAAAWLAEQKGVTWTRTNLRRSGLKGDIDVFATTKDDPNPKVWLGSAKRNGNKHDPAEVKKYQDHFIKDLGTSIASLLK